MFEEIAVWKRANSEVAIRYVGFRNLETNLVWIAFGNYVSIDEDRDISADEMIAAQGTLEYFFDVPPADAELWKPTIPEAVALFIANNPAT